ncbi:unnamed protein product, partial [Adineta ricciae]
LIQLVSPEAMILKLRTFEENFAQWLSNVYFHQQEHFNIENFLQRLISHSSQTMVNNDRYERKVSFITKVMIFTRTSSYMLSMDQRPKQNLTIGTNFCNDQDKILHNYSKIIDILNLSIIENSAQLQNKFDEFRNNHQKNVLIITINTNFDQQRLHIPYIRQLIDSTEYTCNSKATQERKHFLMLIHSPAHDLYHHSCFPSIFLHNWDFYFFDTCATGSAFYLQNLLHLLSPSSELNKELEKRQDTAFCDLNVLFEDCLWAFSSRIQIITPILPKNMFSNAWAHEFYQHETQTIQKVKCLRALLGESSELQRFIVNIYHQHLSKTKNSSTKIHDFIYQISKDILCGKRFESLVESIQMQTKYAFMNFVMNVFKVIVNDYGLETMQHLSADKQTYGSLLHLIDFHSFATENDNDDMFTSQTTQGPIHFTTNYSCIPQTPLFHLFHERISSHANAIKSTYIRRDHMLKCTEQRQESEDDVCDSSFKVTTNSNFTIKNNNTPLTFERFRSELITSIKNDKILSEAVNSSTVHSYCQDLVSTSCSMIEHNFHYDRVQQQQTAEFISKWLSFIDHSDRQSNEYDTPKDIWLLGHIYTTFEYEKSDLLSMYTACRIMHHLELTQSSFTNVFAERSGDRSVLREAFFRSIFDQLWSSLCQSSSNTENHYHKWIFTYTFISKYYPSEKVLEGIPLIDIKCQIQLMNLAYLIFLNEKIPKPQKLVTNLLDKLQINTRSDCLVLLPKILEIIHEENLDNSTWMIDVQQWILVICKSSTESKEEILRTLLSYLNQSTTSLSLSTKQFLFDQLIELFLKLNKDNEPNTDLWDRFGLLSILIECVSNVDHYEILFHPSMKTNDQKIILFDLYFFHLRALLKHQNIILAFLNKGMLLRLSNIQTKEKKNLAESLFKQLKNYFLSIIMALLLIDIESNENDENDILKAFSCLIDDLFSINPTMECLPDYLKLFLSTIISKKSWDYLFNLLRSEKLRMINKDWTTVLYRLLHLNETNDQSTNLHLSHQIQFTFSTNANKSSSFPDLHQPYETLRILMKTSIENNTGEDVWQEVIHWMQNQVDCESPEMSVNQLKSMLFLNIYYDYYCTNQLESVRAFVDVLQELSFFSEEEFTVFRALVNPEQYIIGYHSPDNANSINKLFQINCQTSFELSLRHLLVNLMAMILLGDEKSFLWTFAFDPLSLEHTYGFGSTYQSPIESDGVHYDCGCVITEDGVLERSFDSADNSGLSVPAVYVAYFSTFGALAWHLLTCDRGAATLYGPILSPRAIETTADDHRENDRDTLTKVCDFVYARLSSTFDFLSVRLNHDDACLLLTRSFEQMASLTDTKQEWIQPVYRTFDEKQNAEQEFERHVFYYVFDRLINYKADINHRILQSQIQINLQDYCDQMPFTIEFQHFQTLLNHSKIEVSSNFQLLRLILDSFNILKVTKLIIPLTRFYLLLHHTYTQLIKQDELFTISLNELLERAERCSCQYGSSYNQSEKENHRQIIQEGIDAVNSYHQFSNGLIQPGACNQMEKFSTITFDSPVNVLLTTSNSDEGNIIIRILTVLIRRHDRILRVLSNEMCTNNHYDHSTLKCLVNDITSKKISILQLINHNTGIISLDEQDCQWTQRLCQSCIISNDEYAFINNKSSFTFDFEYIQSQIIRIYLLYCEINYDHITQIYQCYIEQMSTKTENEDLDLHEKYMLLFNNEQIESEWNYLKTIPLDKLYNSFTLLKQIASSLKTSSNDLDQPSTLYSFLGSTDEGRDLLERIKQHGIRDFSLCYLNHMIKLYAQSINGFEHLFADVSPLLRMSIEPQLDAELTQQFDEHILQLNYDNSIEKFQEMNQIITEFLNDLKDSKDLMLQQSSQCFKTTCQILEIHNPILQWIPEGIRCENYVAINIHLIRIRSILQESKVNVEEKTIRLWQEQTECEDNDSETHSHLADPDEYSESEELDYHSMSSSPSVTRQNSVGETNPTYSRSPSQQLETSEIEPLIYDSLFQLSLRSVSYLSLKFMQSLHQYRTERITEAVSASSAPRFIVTLPGEKLIAPFMCKAEKSQARLKKIFDDNHYDHNEFALIDINQIFVDINEDNFLPLQKSPIEYRIVKREDLVCVKFHFHSLNIEYVTTITNQLETIIKHFINNHIQSNDNYLCFYDQYGALIENVCIENVFDKSEKCVNIVVKEKTVDDNSICEINLTSKENVHQSTIFFDLEATWFNIEQWLKVFCQRNHLSVNDYAFMMAKERILCEKTESIGSIIDATQSSLVDVINQQLITSVTISYENKSESFHVLASMKIIQLFKDKNFQENFNIIDHALTNFMVNLEKENESLTLTEEQMQQSIETYRSASNDSLHFRLFIPTSIIIKYNEEIIPLVLQTRNITIREILKKLDESMIRHRCLVLKETQRVLEGNEILSDLCGIEFLLVEENEIRHVCIQFAEINIKQCFIKHATIADLCKEQKLILDTQHVIYSNKIILLPETPLTCFQSKTPICFSITENNLPIRVTVKDDQQPQKSITFFCDSSITIEDLRSLSCHFLCVIEDGAKLALTDGTILGDDLSLMDIVENLTEIEFQLGTPLCLSCSITCSNHTIVLPCQLNQTISSLVSDLFDQLSILSDQMETYTLFALGTVETGIDVELSIEDIKDLFPPSTSTIKIELRK